MSSDERILHIAAALPVNLGPLVFAIDAAESEMTGVRLEGQLQYADWAYESTRGDILRILHRQHPDGISIIHFAEETVLPIIVEQLMVVQENARRRVIRSIGYDIALRAIDAALNGDYDDAENEKPTDIDREDLALRLRDLHVLKVLPDIPLSDSCKRICENAFHIPVKISSIEQEYEDTEIDEDNEHDPESSEGWSEAHVEYDSLPARVPSFHMSRVLERLTEEYGDSVTLQQAVDYFVNGFANDATLGDDDDKQTIRVSLIETIARLALLSDDDIVREVDMLNGSDTAIERHLAPLVAAMIDNAQEMMAMEGYDDALLDEIPDVTDGDAIDALKSEHQNDIDTSIVDTACDTEVDVLELLEASRELFKQSQSEEAQFSIRFFDALIELGYERMTPATLATIYVAGILDELFAEMDSYYSNGTFDDMLEDVVAAALENVDAFILRYGTMGEEECNNENRYRETLDKYVHAVMDRLEY